MAPAESRQSYPGKYRRARVSSPARTPGARARANALSTLFADDSLDLCGRERRCRSRPARAAASERHRARLEGERRPALVSRSPRRPPHRASCATRTNRERARRASGTDSTGERIRADFASGSRKRPLPFPSPRRRCATHALPARRRFEGPPGAHGMRGRRPRNRGRASDRTRRGVGARRVESTRTRRRRNRRLARPRVHRRPVRSSDRRAQDSPDAPTASAQTNRRSSTPGATRRAEARGPRHRRGDPRRPTRVGGARFDRGRRRCSSRRASRAAGSSDGRPRRSRPRRSPSFRDTTSRGRPTGERLREAKDSGPDCCRRTPRGRRGPIARSSRGPRGRSRHDRSGRRRHPLAARHLDSRSRRRIDA